MVGRSVPTPVLSAKPARRWGGAQRLERWGDGRSPAARAGVRLAGPVGVDDVGRHRKEYYFSARETRCIGDYDILLYKTAVDAHDATARLLAQPSTGFRHMAINPPVTGQEDVVTNNSVTIGLFAYRNIQFYIYAVTIIGGESPVICRRRVVTVASMLVQHTDAYAARGASASHSVAYAPKGSMRIRMNNPGVIGG